MRLLFFSFFGLAALGCGSSAAGTFAGGAGGYSGTGAATGTTTYSTFTTTFSTTYSTTLSSGTTTTPTGSGGASTSSSSSSSTSSSTGGTDGGPAGSGDCHTGADCPSGQCVAVTPGGFHVCVVPQALATVCASALDQCCQSQPCAGGAPCYVGPLVPVCAGVPQPVHNVCGVDQCTKDVDCAPGQICALAGTLGLEIRACVDAHCKVDADCTAHAGGVCAPVQEPCCVAPAGLFCVYPGDGGCRRNADCPTMPGQVTYCSPDATSGVASCQNGAPVCPA